MTDRLKYAGQQSNIKKTTAKPLNGYAVVFKVSLKKLLCLELHMDFEFNIVTYAKRHKIIQTKV